MTPTIRETALGPLAMLASFIGSDAPTIHFAHATGMCATLYRPVLALLAPHANVIASDARGHGATRLPADPAAMTSWATYVDDLSALLDSLPAPSRLILAGHSLGATVSMLLAAAIPDRVAAAVLVEPAIVPFAIAPHWATMPRTANPMIGQALRRRAIWSSRAQVRAAYRGRGVFAGWADADLDAYLDGGLRQRSDGQVELACAPAWEAATFAAVSAGLEGAVTGWRGGLTLLHGTERSTVTADDAAAIAASGATVRRFVGADHFLPLHEPAAIAEAILAYL